MEAAAVAVLLVHSNIYYISSLQIFPVIFVYSTCISEHSESLLIEFGHLYSESGDRLLKGRRTVLSHLEDEYVACIQFMMTCFIFRKCEGN